MSLHALKDKKEKASSKSSNPKGLAKEDEASLAFSDNRPQSMALENQIGGINASSQVKQLFKYQSKADQFTENKTASLAKLMGNQKQSGQAAIQRKENGLPSALRSGVEQLSGISMGDVKVHHNSDKPAQLQAHAYAQGTDIHLGPGQEKHLPHEAWHVVQQKQGRVAPTVQMKGQVAINDSQHLEKEADTFGAKAQKLGMSSEVGNQAGVAQRMGMGEEVLQGKFASGKVAQLEENDKVAEGVETGMTVVGVADKINTAVSTAAGKDGLISKGKISDDASGIAGTVFSSLQSLVDFVKSGANLWEKRNWESGADFFLQAADTASSIMSTLAQYEVMGAIPVLGPAIAAFKAGMGIFKSNRSLKLLREFEEGKKTALTEDEKLTLNRYVSSLKVEIGSNSIDFALSIGKAVGDFFPVVGTAFGIAQTAKGAFEAGYNAWVSYRSSKEKQALSRISGGSEAELGEEELAKAGALASKAAKSEPDSLKSSKGTLLDMVNMKFEIESNKSLLDAATDEAEKTRLSAVQGALIIKLNESITIYNTTMGNIGESTKITIGDIENLQAIHTKVIRRYLDKKEEEKSLWERAKSTLGGPLAPLKDVILGELNKLAPEVTDADIKELSKGQHSAALWKKTQTALEDASKGRKYFTRAELDANVTKILKKYKVPDDQIALIVRS